MVQMRTTKPAAVCCLKSSIFHSCKTPLQSTLSELSLHSLLGFSEFHEAMSVQHTLEKYMHAESCEPHVLIQKVEMEEMENPEGKLSLMKVC